MQTTIFLQFVDFTSEATSKTDKIIQNIILFVIFVYPIYALIEALFARLFHKHFFIHVYFVKKKLSHKQKQILLNEFPFYRKLTEKGKKYFEHRVAVYIQKYSFYGKENFEVTDGVQLIIAGTFAMVSFGMRNYLPTVFNKIIVYPSEYYSTHNEQYHKGEFNPNARAIAFSWKDYLISHQDQTNNLNLGIHEFVHVLHFQSQKSHELSFIIFSDLFDQIVEYVTIQSNLDRIIKSNYFRVYAFTNNYEFLAVMLEHFFETPKQFLNEFPELYLKVEKLVNYNEKYFIE